MVGAGRHVVIQSEADVVSAGKHETRGKRGKKNDSVVIGYSLRQGKIFVMIG